MEGVTSFVVTSKFQSPPKVLLPVGLAEAAMFAFVNCWSFWINSSPASPAATLHPYNSREEDDILFDQICN